MLLSKRRVTAPDGTEWEVSVDWTRRPVRLPHAYRLGTGRKDAGDVASSALDMPSFGDHGVGFADLADDVLVTIVAVIVLIVGGLLVWFVIWPLLAIATELAVVATIAVAGLVGRLFFGRPWVIEAVSAGGTEHRWQVRGIAAARRTIDEVADRLAAGLGAASYE